MFARIRQFFRFILPGIIRPLRVLWNEVIGFVFLALAVWAILSGVRTIREYEGDGDSIFRVVLAGVFVVLMLWFGISSFLRARKISRSS